jgi:transposase-like protein
VRIPIRHASTCFAVTGLACANVDVRSRERKADGLMEDGDGFEERRTARDDTTESSGAEGDAIDNLRVDLLPIEVIPLEVLRRGDSPRSSGRSTKHVELLAEIGLPLPPIIVHSPSMRIIDGMHRAEAARRRGDQVIHARLFRGTQAAAFQLAVHANVTHGLPLTLADRTNAACRMLRSQPDLSDRAIARTAGLSPTTIHAIRQRLSPGTAGAVGRRGRDGRVRPLDGSDGRRMAAAMLSERPEASLREIAREVGISPTTVRDVRERVKRGESPTPFGHRSPDRTTDRRMQRIDVPTSVVSGRDPAQLLRSLRNDPSLRFSEAGRALITWLNERATGVGRWPDLLPQIPPHCTYLLADIARSCAAEWIAFADELGRHRRQTEDAPVDVDDATVLRNTVA